MDAETNAIRVLVADDDPNLLKLVARELLGKGFACETVSDGAAAMEAMGKAEFDVALLDIEMPELDGFQVLDAMHGKHPDTVPVILTGKGDIPRAVKAVKLGAFDFLEKPCNPHLLEHTIRRAGEYRRAHRHARKMEAEADETRTALQLERALNQAQKLESVGRLAAGIAHEINTPAQYVGDNLEFLQSAHADIVALINLFRRLMESPAADALPPDLLNEARDLIETAHFEYLANEIPRAIAQSIEGIGRITSIVQAMKEFSHPGVTEKTLADINHCIESTATVSRNEWKYVADLEMDLDPSLPRVWCLPAELNQVFLNLIVNAAHAIADVVGDGSETKGRIMISTRRDGDWVEIRISDTGTGIPDEFRDRIFDPFFTTKEVGKGTGQGLAIARNVVVNKHSGTLSVESEVGKGTAFIIRLPVVEG
ncbi:MAG TPA: response regulator [Candidatus Hydrogenedentes bacterium]|nr:response regulator [Candidatus Hydrogenedentota bacterium]